MTEKPSKPDLTEYEEEETPLDDVLRRLLSAKPATPKESKQPSEKSQNDHR